MKKEVKQAGSGDEKPRRRYTPPKLVEHGDVIELTRGAIVSAATDDGMLTFS